MAPIISFHYEMKLSWKRMRKFHTLEIRFCKCCVRIPGYEHIKSHFFCPPLCSCSVLFLWQTDKNLQRTANWPAKSHFQGLTALFLLLIYIFLFWQYRGFVHLYILVKRTICFFVFNLLKKKFWHFIWVLASGVQWRRTERQWVVLPLHAEGPAVVGIGINRSRVRACMCVL